MVSKAAIGIVLLVFVLMAGVSIAVGTMLLGGGSGGAQTTTHADDSGGGNNGGNSGGNGDNNGGNGTAATTVATTPKTTSLTAPTVTPDNATTTANATTTSVPASSFNETLIAERTAEKVNRKRRNRGLHNLSTSGSTVRHLEVMARNHSDAMAGTETVQHTIDGVSMRERYKSFDDLYEVCQWEAADSDSVRYPRDNNFEAIGKIFAGRTYQQRGETRYNRNESQVADAIADFWFHTPSYKDALTYPNAQRIGVAVNVTDSGAVYATANVC
ncbi:MAG: CAP domain-containing protein [Haloarculaceae archaeon]